jgi:DNA-binding NarL/FixJ family response regulator
MITGTLELDRPLSGPLAPAARLTEAEPTRLLVVDAHPLARWALLQLASGEADLATVGEAADAEQALTLASAFGPDVITLDTALPDGQVWKLARTLREADERVGIVIITDDAGDDTLFRALDCGASALVHKSAPIREILSAVRHAAGSPGSFTASGLSAALRRRRDTPGRAVLSPREQQILELLHDGLSVPQIAAHLFVSLSTAKTYVARRYDKLDARNRAQALMTAARLGLFDDCTTPRQEQARLARTG